MYALLCDAQDTVLAAVQLQNIAGSTAAFHSAHRPESTCQQTFSLGGALTNRHFYYGKQFITGVFICSYNTISLIKQKFSAKHS